MTKSVPKAVASRLARNRKPLNSVIEWQKELCRLRGLSVRRRLNLHALHPNTIDLRGGSVGQIGLPTVTLLDRADKVYAIGETVSGLCIVDPKTPDEWTPIDAIGRLVPNASLPAFLVNLDHSDDVIRAEVDRVLAEARKVYKTSYRKTGPKPSQLDWPGTFIKWRNHRIVELAELLVWQSLSQDRRRDFPENVLGEWLGFDRNQTSYAKTVLKRAIASLPMLEAHARYDRDPDEFALDRSS